jgi:hypothetical protein
MLITKKISSNSLPPLRLSKLLGAAAPAEGREVGAGQGIRGSLYSMTQKKFFYLCAAACLLLCGLGVGLVSLFFGIGHIRTLFLSMLLGSLLGVPALIFLLLALFTHSAEPFMGKSQSSRSSSLLAALGFAALVALLVYLSTLFLS